MRQWSDVRDSATQVVTAGIVCQGHLCATEPTTIGDAPLVDER